TGATKQRPHSIRWLRTVVEPVVHAVVLQIQRLLTLTRRVLTNDLQELAVARALRVRDHDTKRRLLFPAGAPEANLDHRAFTLHGFVERRAHRVLAVRRAAPVTCHPNGRNSGRGIYFHQSEPTHATNIVDPTRSAPWAAYY